MSESRNIAIINNLSVIGHGEDTCEVYKNYSKKFVAIKSPTTDYLRLNHAISIGSKIFAFQHVKWSTFCYDVDNYEWTEEQCDATNDIGYFSCVKVPWF